MRAKKVDNNQREIVDALRDIPGVSVEVGHDDLLLGYKGVTYWLEIKSPDAISKRTGRVKESEITASERDRLHNWQGHYMLAWTLEQILDELGIVK